MVAIPYLWSRPLASVTLAIVLLFVVSSCGEGDEAPSPTPAPTEAASTTTTTPNSPTPAPTLTTPASTPSTPAKAYIEVTRDQGIDTSTYGSGAFLIRNESSEEVRIRSVTLDISSAILPDVVFDPEGTGGDPVGKAFTVDSGGEETGYTGHEYSLDVDGGGYQRLGISFSDFDPDEELTFSIDIDPTSIKGVAAPGPRESGSVSGLELSGAVVTIETDRGETLRGALFAISNDPGGAWSLIAQDTRVRLSTEIDEHSQVHLSGPPRARVEAFVFEAGLFLEGVPDGGFDVEPGEANSVTAAQWHRTNLDETGKAVIPAEIADGVYVLGAVAAVLDESGLPIAVSNVVHLVARP